MKPEIDINGKRVWVLAMQNPGEFAIPFDTKPYPCLVFASIQTDQEYKAQIAEQIIGSGCGYVVCGGVESMAWHDAMDESSIAAEISGELKEEETAVTTWHEDESIDDVAFFFALNTFLPESEGHTDFVDLLSADYLVLLIGEMPERRELTKRIGYYLDPKDEPAEKAV